MQLSWTARATITETIDGVAKTRIYLLGLFTLVLESGNVRIQGSADSVSP